MSIFKGFMEAINSAFNKGFMDSISSVFKGFMEAINSAFNSDSPSSTSTSTYSSSVSEMDGVATGNERIAYKLKGYFELAKDEIAKAIKDEEWGLPESAISHYQNAQKILAEAMSTPVPSYVTSRELEKVKSHRQNISKWQGEVSERLQTLGRRTGGAYSVKVTAPRLQTVGDAPITSYTRKATSQKPSSKISSGSFSNNQTNNSISPKHSPKVESSDDAKLVEKINSLILDRSLSVKWEDIAGLEKAKQALLEMVILPTKRKDLFTKLRKPAKGLLLFGPPGTGKTMLARAVASESQATFFNVSAASVTSKWVGEGEKLIRALFTVAISRQPSVIFMDEIDSIMSTRTSNENEASRRLKSEFLVQFDGVTSNSDDLVIVIGATNKPQDLDDAVLRRLVKRIYIPLPDANVRSELLKHTLKDQEFSLPDGDLERLVNETDGYSGSDLHALCTDAAMMPIRELIENGEDILRVKRNQVRRLRYGDFQKAMTQIRASLQKSRWEELEQWNKQFGVK